MWWIRQNKAYNSVSSDLQLIRVIHIGNAMYAKFRRRWSNSQCVRQQVIYKDLVFKPIFAADSHPISSSSRWTSLPSTLQNGRHVRGAVIT